MPKLSTDAFVLLVAVLALFGCTAGLAATGTFDKTQAAALLGIGFTAIATFVRGGTAAPADAPPNPAAPPAAPTPWQAGGSPP